jgi:hypothetical protein
MPTKKPKTASEKRLAKYILAEKNRIVHLTLGPIFKKPSDTGEFVPEHCKAECSKQAQPFWNTTVYPKKITCVRCKKLYSKNKAEVDKAVRALKKERKESHFAEDATVSRAWGDVEDARRQYREDDKAFKKKFPHGFPDYDEIKFVCQGHFKDGDEEEDEDAEAGFKLQLRSSFNLAKYEFERPSMNKRDKTLSKLMAEDDDNHYGSYLGKGKILIHGSCLNRCYKCSEEVEFVFDTKTKKATAKTTCPNANGIPAYSVEMDVPSGKLLIANDLRHWIDVAAEYDVNYVNGQKRTAEAYAANGMFHFSVGNTCPGIYQKGNVITLGNAKHEDPSDIDEDEEELKGKALKVAERAAEAAYEARKAPYGKELGSVCTDLWWWSGADYDYLKQRAGKDFQRLVKDHYTTVVKLTPGRYKATGLSHIARQHENKEYKAYCKIADLQEVISNPKKVKAEIKRSSYKRESDERLLKLSNEQLRERLAMAHGEYKALKANAPDFDVLSTIERIGDCTGEVFGAEELKLQAAPSFDEYVKLCRLAYPRIYPSRERVLESLFGRISGGRDWNDGTLFHTSEAYERARKELADGAVVKFNKANPNDLMWDLSEGYSAMTVVPDNVRPDWLAGIYECFDLIDSIDNDVYDKKHARYQRKAAAQKEVANKFRKQLDERFGGRPVKQKSGSYKFIRQPAVANA